MFGFFRKNYNTYKSYLEHDFFNFKFLDNEVPQGLCIIDNKVYITCYKTDNTSSLVIEYTMNGERLRTISLNNRAHVGGIGYIKKYNTIFICDSNGYISSYNYDNFSKINSYNVSTDKGSKLLENNNLVCSYLTCYLDKIYVGSFNLDTNGVVKVYNIKKIDSKITLNYEREFIVPSKTQGLTFYKYNDEEFIFISTSYGRRNNSTLYMSLYDKSKNEYLNNYGITLPPMLEQITIFNNELVLLFESSSTKYRKTCKYVVEDLVSLNIEKVIKDYKNS